MYKQDLEQTLLGIDEEAELEIGPRDDRPSVVLVGGSAFMLNDVTNLRLHMTSMCLRRTGASARS